MCLRAMFGGRSGILGMSGDSLALQPIFAVGFFIASSAGKASLLDIIETLIEAIACLSRHRVVSRPDTVHGVVQLKHVPPPYGKRIDA